MRKVIITAGHNGAHTGANGYIDEGAETIQLRNIVVKKLREMGVAVQTDKDTDALSKVVAWIKKIVGINDIVVDIHFNAAGASATGVEVVVSRDGKIERTMAKEICERIAKTLGIANRGVKTEAQTARGKLAMMSNFACEQILIEVCFVSNKSDAEAYNAKKWLVAQDIADVVAKYAKK